MKNKEFYIWLAGFIDGEGCIGIYKHTYSHNPQIMLQISNTYKIVLDYILVNLGVGSICGAEKSNPKNKDAWKYSVYSGSVIEICKKCLPYLKVKHLQAELVIEFWSKYVPYLKQKQGWKKVENKDYYVSKMKELNRKGCVVTLDAD